MFKGLLTKISMLCLGLVCVSSLAMADPDGVSGSNFIIKPYLESTTYTIPAGKSKADVPLAYMIQNFADSNILIASTVPFQYRISRIRDASDKGVSYDGDVIERNFQLFTSPGFVGNYKFRPHTEGITAIGINFYDASCGRTYFKQTIESLGPGRYEFKIIMGDPYNIAVPYASNVVFTVK